MDKGVVQLFSDAYKRSIIQAITDAFRKDAQDFAAEFDLETKNGNHFLKWDFINTNLIRNVSDDKLLTIKRKRGNWELILLYDSETRYLYSLMKRKRFIQLAEQRKNRTKAHYLDALVSFNTGLQPQNGFIQLSLFSDNSWDKQVHRLLHDLVHEHQDEIERFVLISFSTGKDDITSVSAIVPTVDLSIAYEEDWSEFIPAEFTQNNVELDYTPSLTEEEEIVVKLKPEVQTRR